MIFWVGFQQGFVLLVGRRGAEGGAVLERTPEAVAVAHELGDFGFEVGDVTAQVSDEVAGVFGAGVEVAGVSEANRADN
jgi:hypothetical protein